MKVLIAEDDRDFGNILTQYVTISGFDVTLARDGKEAWDLFSQDKPDICVLDVMMPGMDGIELLTRLRRESDVYVIMLTARTEETDKIIGLSVGADDYVTKPFSPRELTARVKAALRRIKTGTSGSEERRVLSFKHILIDVGAHTVSVNNVPIELTSIEFDLLHALAENRGRVLSREQLLEKIWGADYFGETRVVDVHLGHVRQKLGNESLITTVRGVGYRFEDEQL
jgi:two-component system alkaline phosphatase synthesis response regulator PhoP